MRKPDEFRMNFSHKRAQNLGTATLAITRGNLFNNALDQPWAFSRQTDNEGHSAEAFCAFWW